MSEGTAALRFDCLDFYELLTLSVAAAPHPGGKNKQVLLALASVRRSLCWPQSLLA